MTPDYQIITRHLVLRLITHEESFELQQRVCHSPTLHQWIDWCSPAFTLKEAERFVLMTRLNWVKSESYGFGIFLRSNETLVGMVAINELYHTFNMASVGYWIADKFQHHGFAKEALDALIEFCFAMLKVTRIEVICSPDNKPSQKLATACGAEFESLAKNRFIFNGQPQVGAVYSIIPE
ncbi:N-acetyltransferase [Vibrio sinensis]|uniref:N-acetyltransferase n=1 Tax=Vibrio sinensis TaxID=2302434 RepID=A0A3A6QHP2_9VIBR|nr:GNAT family protein [Vibrio sinensis]RJX72045.1 N-acetyltransferase [Vibrio sinensis]